MMDFVKLAIELHNGSWIRTPKYICLIGKYMDVTVHSIGLSNTLDSTLQYKEYAKYVPLDDIFDALFISKILKLVTCEIILNDATYEFKNIYGYDTSLIKEKMVEYKLKA